MTDLRDTIRAVGRDRGLRVGVVRLVASGLLGALGATACTEAPPPAPTPPSGLVPSEPLDHESDKAAVDPALGPADAWYDRYHAYMTAEARRDYLVTPEPDRFERFGTRLLDYQLREELLREHQDELTRDEQDAYRSLPSAESCRGFIRERAGRAPAAPGKDPLAPDVAAPSTGSKTKPPR
ncbi:hypothetical protein HY251_09135 [bacterium]|nr:hypothetical protein [bacterium]